MQNNQLSTKTFLSLRALSNGSHRLIRKISQKIIHQLKIKLLDIAQQINQDKIVLFEYFKKKLTDSQEANRIRKKLRDWLLICLMRMSEQQLGRISKNISSVFHNEAQPTRIVISQNNQINQSDQPLHAVYFKNYYIMDKKKVKIKNQHQTNIKQILIPLQINILWMQKQFKDILNWNIQDSQQNLPFQLKKFIMDLLYDNLIPLPFQSLQNLLQKALPHILQQLKFKKSLYQWKNTLMGFSMIQPYSQRQGLVWVRLQTQNYCQDIQFDILQQQISIDQFVNQLCLQNNLKDCKGILSNKIRMAVFEQLQIRYVCLKKLYNGLSWQRDKISSHTSSLRKVTFNSCSVQFCKTIQLSQINQDQIQMNWELQKIILKNKDLLSFDIKQKLNITQQPIQLNLSLEQNQYIPNDLKSRLSYQYYLKRI